MMAPNAAVAIPLRAKSPSGIVRSPAEYFWLLARAELLAENRRRCGLRRLPAGFTTSILNGPLSEKDRAALSVAAPFASRVLITGGTYQAGRAMVACWLNWVRVTPRRAYISMKTRRLALRAKLRGITAALQTGRTTGPYHAATVRKAAGRTSRGAAGRWRHGRRPSRRGQETTACSPATGNAGFTA